MRLLRFIGYQYVHRELLLVGVIQFFIPFFAFSLNSEISFDIFFQENGLPNNQIQCIYQDSKGWLWIGTSQGLSRFDGYNFENFIPNSDDTNSLNGNLVRVITEDKDGNLLVGTEHGGLNIFDREKERFSQSYKAYEKLIDRDVSVNAIEKDRYGNTWIGTEFNIFVIDTAGLLSAVSPKYSDSGKIFEQNFIRNLRFDKNETLWIGTNNGIFFYNPSTNLIEPFELPFGENQNKQIEEIYVDEEGFIWIGTYSSGAFLIDAESKKLTKIELSPNVERSELVRAITKGAYDEYWIGTRAGLYVYSKSRGVTSFYRHDERNPTSLSNNSVQYVFCDTQGETWIGTRKGLNLLAKSKQVFHSFTAFPGDKHYLNSSSVYALWIDEDENIWVGTEDGGINIYNPETGTYEYLKHEKGNSNSISQNCIKAFEADGKGNLWVGTFLGGVDVVNLETGKISHFKHNPDIPGTISSDEVWDICLDENGEIWVASSGGVDKYLEASNSFLHYPQINGDESVFWVEIDSNDNMWFGSLNEVIIYNPTENTIKRYFERSRSMYEDSKNRIWIATRGKGIAIYTAAKGPLTYLNETNGLPNNEALCIEEDSKNNLWISTTNGLSKFDPEKGFFRNFTSKDGLTNNQFCYQSSFKNKSGELLFGSVSGFNIFNPAEIESEDPDIPLVFTDFKIFNKSVPISDEKDAVLEKSISETEHLVLNYNQDVFTLEFAALNYVAVDKNLYTYKLEGFNADWNEPSKIRSATYTNLNPGDYVLRIKRFLPGIGKETNELQLKITVLPPYWKTSWFLGILMVLTVSLIYIIIQFFLNREKIKHQLVLEKVNARKLHEIDMMKLKFFTNISHEVRTPLTLILGPLNKLIQQDYSKEEVKENLYLMLRNAEKLDKLISQLLDFRKLQTGKLKLNLTEADIVDFTRKIVNSFNKFAEEKEVTLKFNTLKKSLNAAFDPDKVEKILDNLLSNAFKYTAQGGAITVNLSLVFDSNNNDFNETEKEKQFIEITVKDTGKGIPENNLNKIFQRFFQSNAEDENHGFGIGLALVKELVDIHKGDVFVNSKQGKGTKFTIRIPYYSSIQERPIDVRNETNEDLHLTEPFFETEGDGISTLNSKIMLIVEDNADVRKFISGHFISTYKIIEAKDGEEGWQMALEIVPDIIISDILMPVSDGYELCKRLKNDERTSHIPVLMLTALHSRENEIKGLTTGADDFITKPFDLSVLQAKVENVLSIRESLKQKFMRTVFLEPRNVEISSPDERFLQKAIDLIESNISNSDLDIESFAKLIGVSRMQLYRKIHALTDMTVKEFIRNIRLKRAAQLLVQNKINVSEVAYGVGFKDLSHFRKCFKREYGMSASEYIIRNKQSGSENILKEV
ncbi:hybrid sensor histidine kinase/response regulator transcription factor [Maribellus maritimus]|uniref:hybrid sensor histidine kinase/response regulator transcription factor n=1 Tax=Maribellus maritimus TaxID=2870838 RepID=UPI001EEB201A|nr:hybrid sensor histidine kinase/response regulator transcription factor [Maribellus maritimus]MCG6191032.1 response regulator [Maribellus maritimus]